MKSLIWKVFRVAFNGVEAPAAGVSAAGVSTGPAANFTPPAVPRLTNDTGLPRPPSGLHPSTSPQLVVTQVGALAHPQPSSLPAENIHGSHPEFG